MAVAFKKYSREDSDLKKLGTVSSLAGKGGSFRFSKKNFTSKRLNKSGNRVALIVILLKKNGDSAMLPCSQQVSELVRAGDINIKQFRGLPIVEIVSQNDEGEEQVRHFVTLPQGEAAEAYSADGEIDEIEISDDFLPDNFITA